MQDRLRNLGQYRPTRRQLLEAGLKTAKYGAAGFVGWAAKDYFTPQSQPQLTPDTTTQNKEKTMDILLQEILDIPPFLKAHVGNPERIRKENEYVGRVSQNLTLSDIDRGFWILTHQPARAELLELRYNLRLKGTEKKLKPIPDEKLKWAKVQRIHPEVLGICLDNYERARDLILKKLIDAKKLRDDTTVVTAEETMINAGGLAKLITEETGPFNFLGESYGFSNIGQDMAINQMFGDGAEADRAALEKISETFFRKTKLRLNPKHIAGSVSGEDDESGGAVGPQFRPGNADKHEKLIEGVTGEIFNVFDVNDAVVMIWEFIARHEYVGKDIYGNDAYRVGYRKGVKKDITNAIVKWYGAPGIPARKTEAAAYNYYDELLDPNLPKSFTY